MSGLFIGAERIEALKYKLSTLAAPAVLEATHDAARAAANRAKEELTLRMQSNPQPGLMSSTRARKRREGANYPRQTWMESGFTTKNALLAPRIRRTSTGFTVNINVSKRPIQQPGKDSRGRTLAMIVSWLENGTVTQAARPVIGPFRDELAENGGWLVSELRLTAYNTLYRLLR